MKHRSNKSLMLAHRLRYRPNIRPTQFNVSCLLQYCIRLLGQQGESRAKASKGRASLVRFKYDILFKEGLEKVETGAQPEQVLIN